VHTLSHHSRSPLTALKAVCAVVTMVGMVSTCAHACFCFSPCAARLSMAHCTLRTASAAHPLQHSVYVHRLLLNSHDPSRTRCFPPTSRLLPVDVNTEFGVGGDKRGANPSGAADGVGGASSDGAPDANQSSNPRGGLFVSLDTDSLFSVSRLSMASSKGSGDDGRALGNMTLEHLHIPVVGALVHFDQHLDAVLFDGGVIDQLTWQVRVIAP
jgi:hypothetical protein